MNAARSAITSGGRELISLQAVEGDWHALRELALWLFHTPPGAVPNLAPDTPAAAIHYPHPPARPLSWRRFSARV